MKFFALAALLGAVTAVVVQPYRHGHHHVHREAAERGGTPAFGLEPGPVTTVVVYILNDKPIAEEEVRQGIANGTLIWGDDGNLSTFFAATPTPAPSPSAGNENPSASGKGEAEEMRPPQSSAAAAAPSSAIQSEPVPSPKPAPAFSQPLIAPAVQSYSNEDIDKEFPNDTLPCDSFPAGYGALPIEYQGLGGWTGVQDPRIHAEGGYGDIETGTPGTCHGGSCCKPGAFCSYNCPPGYLKSSWPAQQGIKGQSVGGLKCNNDGKLEMGDGSISKQLCVKGTDKVTVKVQNKLSGQGSSICRTDYPGTEGMTLPATTSPGQSVELACPDSDRYYHAVGKGTSAQYYVNKKGVPETEACQWNDGTTPVGNWAPLVLGVGYTGSTQKAYISIFQNNPTTNETLDYTVELFSPTMSPKTCRYSNGEYRSGDHYEHLAHGDNRGCTVAIDAGSTLTIELRDD